MCGISGVITREPGDAREVIDRQLALLHHRGPDAQGVFAAGTGGIGQNRLAVIGVRDGDPPITNEDGSLGVTLNGEIYNYRQEREGLLQRGHRFTTGCDTEVIAHLAEELEPVELASRLDGMFAFAVWDSRRGHLVLGRDRLGKKPLYYWASHDLFVFASEIKAVFAHPSVPRVLEPGALPAYLTFGYVPTPYTFFAGVLSLPPGHVMTVEPGSPPRIERYWEPRVPGASSAEPLEPSRADAQAQVRTKLQSAVNRRLEADVPLGAFLSGGIDSSAVVALMAGLLDHPVSTFTIGFEDRDGFDERPYARLVADRYATDHHEFVVRPNAVDLIERLVWHHDQPFGDSSAVPTFLLSEMTREHVTVALCGDGGDELFAGYERFAAGLALRQYTALPKAVRQLAHGVLGHVPGSALAGRVGSLQRFTAAAALDPIDAYRSWVGFIDESLRKSLLADTDEWASESFRAVWEASAGARPLDRLLDLNMRTYLLDDLLVKADRMSMAHGLEVRSPFLDREFVEFALRLPPRLKMRRMSLKRVLKDAVRDLVPAEILERRKHGFGVPVDRWFREDLRTYVGSTLGTERSRVRARLAPGVVDDLLAAHATGAGDHGHTLWRLLALEIFLRNEGW